MKKITVAIIGTKDHDLMKFSVETTLNNLDDCEDILVFSDKKIVDYGTYIPIKSSFNYSDYADFKIKSLGHFIKTEFVLVIEWDGMAVNKSFWRDEFYKYDYIGGPWDSKICHWIDEYDNLVGGGGFTLRSAKLLEALKDQRIIRYPDCTKYDGEDSVICRGYAPLLREKYGIKYAPFDVANMFSNEVCNPSGNTFGFHGIWNFPLYFNDDIVKNALVKSITQHSSIRWQQFSYNIFVNNCKRTNKEHLIDFLHELFAGVMSRGHDDK